jgi:GR25 family glycosyltransferase involved in LPS biosynthesis
MDGAAVACIVLAVFVALFSAMLAIAIAQRHSCGVHSMHTRAPATFARAYIIHSKERADRAHIVRALSRIATKAVQTHGSADAHPRVRVWPATYTAKDPAAQAQYDACPKEVLGVLPAEFGCTTSHMRALQHALRVQPELAEPRSTQWVLMFEDDSELRPKVSDESAVARMRATIGHAAAQNIDLVYFGGNHRLEDYRSGAQKPLPERTATKGVWRAPPQVCTHAYAVRGAIIPALLRVLERRRCNSPIDDTYRIVFSRTMCANTGDALQSLLGHAGLFIAAETPSSIPRRYHRTIGKRPAL